MRAGVHSPAFVLGALLIFAEGCGGGGGGGTQTPPLQPDFAIAFSTAAISLSQGNASAPLTVSVSGLNGFSGSVQVVLSGIPSGVTTAPVSPFSIAAGQSVSVIFGAAPTAATGEFNFPPRDPAERFPTPRRFLSRSSQAQRPIFRDRAFCQMIQCRQSTGPRVSRGAGKLFSIPRAGDFLWRIRR